MRGYSRIGPLRPRCAHWGTSPKGGGKGLLFHEKYKFPGENEQLYDFAGDNCNY
jgi:hypothetical protein